MDLILSIMVVIFSLICLFLVVSAIIIAIFYLKGRKKNETTAKKSRTL